MSKKNKKPGKSGTVHTMTERELCALGCAVCDTVHAEQDSALYRGGIYPANLRETDAGIVIGAASQGAWSKNELPFLAPELFWDGQRSPAADVYSVGMLLYFRMTGKLPFEDTMDEAHAAKCRMRGDAFPAPAGAGRRFGEILLKATAFRPSDRYADLRSLRAALESCSAEFTESAAMLLGKEEHAMNDIERMLHDILSESAAPQETEEEAPAEETPVEETPVEETPVEDVPVEDTPVEDTPVENAPVEDAPVEDAPTEEETPLPIPILVPYDDPELAPIASSAERSEGVQYDRRLEREKRIREEVRKRRRRPLMFVLFLCALVIVSALIFKLFSDDIADTAITTIPPVTEAPVTPSPVPTEAPVEETPAPVEKVSTYTLYFEDVSWEEAEARCVERGGHLVTISDENELNTVISLANSNNATYVWIGCRRVGGELVWVSGESVDFYRWDVGEPSLFDGPIAEDYVLLWLHNGNWCYNDSRLNLLDESPAYSGNIAYICEIES